MPPQGLHKPRALLSALQRLFSDLCRQKMQDMQLWTRRKSAQPEPDAE